MLSSMPQNNYDIILYGPNANQAFIELDMHKRQNFLSIVDREVVFSWRYVQMHAIPYNEMDDLSSQSSHLNNAGIVLLCFDPMSKNAIPGSLEKIQRYRIRDRPILLLLYTNGQEFQSDRLVREYGNIMASEVQVLVMQYLDDTRVRNFLRVIAKKLLSLT